MKSNGKRYILDMGAIGPVLFERSARARRIGITVQPFRGVRVAVPRRVTWERAEYFTREMADWIIRQIRYAREREKAARQLAEQNPLPERKKARQILKERLAQLAKKYGFTDERVRIANQRSRWGSCSGRNTISLNIQLLRLPDELRDYVILHELVHTRIKSHGPTFWRELDRYVGDSASLRKRLHSYTIMPAEDN